MIYSKLLRVAFTGVSGVSGRNVNEIMIVCGFDAVQTIPAGLYEFSL